MRNAIFLVGCFCLIAVAARAEERASIDGGEGRVRIVEDDAAGIIRFVIDGKEVGHIDADGLHMEGLVEGKRGIVTENVHGQGLPASPTAKVGAP
ncbi:hypothetical protein [Hyphomicrobium sp. MC8b]|uniref:hypothetical protein n=1 Tax=Hyphomicrobium sp. MC8b TaxID=300273 RepID=UPI00391BF274